MKNLIEALTILSKYVDRAWPTLCEHDVLMVPCDVSAVSAEDVRRLDELTFGVYEYGFRSFTFGSC